MVQGSSSIHGFAQLCKALCTVSFTQGEAVVFHCCVMRCDVTMKTDTSCCSEVIVMSDDVIVFSNQDEQSVGRWSWAVMMSHHQGDDLIHKIPSSLLYKYVNDWSWDNQISWTYFLRNPQSIFYFYFCLFVRTLKPVLLYLGPFLLLSPVLSTHWGHFVIKKKGHIQSKFRII